MAATRDSVVLASTGARHPDRLTHIKTEHEVKTSGPAAIPAPIEAPPQATKRLLWRAISTQFLRWSCVLARYDLRISQLRVASLWFSTLGGAYSALGDTRISYSRKALELAALQLRLGTTLGDDTLVSKCRLYIAWSQIQGGNFTEAEKVVAREERRALPTGSRPDPQVIQMCIAARLKIERNRAALRRQPLAIGHTPGGP
eukprot:m.56319 g.56319  ORF g.56319 m.56319 type:complete len:201 (+) comp9297_c0_seq1:92-694(+)